MRAATPAAAGRPVFGFNTSFGRLAQLVERLLYTQVVAGSSSLTAHREKPGDGAF